MEEKVKSAVNEKLKTYEKTYYAVIEFEHELN